MGGSNHPVFSKMDGWHKERKNRRERTTERSVLIVIEKGSWELPSISKWGPHHHIVAGTSRMRVLRPKKLWRWGPGTVLWRMSNPSQMRSEPLPSPFFQNDQELLRKQLPSQLPTIIQESVGLARNSDTCRIELTQLESTWLIWFNFNQDYGVLWKF